MLEHNKTTYGALLGVNIPNDMAKTCKTSFKKKCQAHKTYSYQLFHSYKKIQSCMLSPKPVVICEENQEIAVQVTHASHL